MKKKQQEVMVEDRWKRRSEEKATGSDGGRKRIGVMVGKEVEG